MKGLDRIGAARLKPQIDAVPVGERDKLRFIRRRRTLEDPQHQCVHGGRRCDLLDRRQPLTDGHFDLRHAVANRQRFD